jgi:zinc transporter 6
MIDGSGGYIFRARLLIGTGVAFVSHIVIIYGYNNAALDHVIAASSSSWLQEHVSDISQRCAEYESLC